MDESRQGNYLFLLLGMDKKGQVSFDRSPESDSELTDLLLGVEPEHESETHRKTAIGAIDKFYSKRPITIGGMKRFYLDLEKSEEGRAILMIEASTTAFGCEAFAIGSAAMGSYELAAAFFAVGAYKAYEFLSIARKNNG